MPKSKLILDIIPRLGRYDKDKEALKKEKRGSGGYQEIGTHYGQKKENEPKFKVLRGGKFDNTSFVRGAEKNFTKISDTSDVKWFFSVFDCYYEDLLRDGLLELKVRKWK